MKDRNVLQTRHFEALLKLFSENREEAGKLYEVVRKKLVQFFLSKSCDHAEQLADETLNRVASKAESFDPARNVRPTTFIFGFASRVHLEYLRGPDRAAVPLELGGVDTKEAPDAIVRDESDFDCLDACLQMLSADDRDLVIKYYSREGHERIELRRQLAEFLDVSPEALHVRVHRIRKSLRKCIDTCLQNKKC
jgi:RNA polymerase sigma factor (sigma-70 family)